jgi:hypothetical protein
VPRPVAVRYAWSMLAEPNLRNAAGLPVGAFRAGTIPKRDLLALKVPESRQYQLVYDLDLSKARGRPVPYDGRPLRRPRPPVRSRGLLPGADRRGSPDPVRLRVDGCLHRPTPSAGVPTAASGIRWQRQVPT